MDRANTDIRLTYSPCVVMNKLFILAETLLLSTLFSYGQGTFLFFNGTAPTRIGSIEGPLAGAGIWAQMLVGRTSEDLQAV